MKKFELVFFLIFISFNGMSQDTQSTQQVLASVRQGENFINKPNRKPEDLDSAANSLQHGIDLSKGSNSHTADGELLFLKALITKNKGAREEARRLNDSALTYLKKKPGSDFLGRVLLEKADYIDLDNAEHLAEKIGLLKEALPCFENPDYVKTRAAVWKMLGDLYQIRYEADGNIGRAIDAYQRSMDIYFSFGYKNVQDIYIEMASMYRSLGDNQQGLRYCLLALQTAEKAGDISPTTCEIYNYTGIQYLLLMDLPNAKKYLTQALELAEKFNDAGGSYNILQNLYTSYRRGKEYKKIKPLIDQVHAHFSENDLQTQIWSNTIYLAYYTDIRDTLNGNKYCSIMLKMLKDHGPGAFPDHGEEAYSDLQDYYGVKRDFRNAYKFWGLENALLRKYRLSISNEVSSLKDHFILDTATKNLNSAVSYLLRYVALRDSIYTVSKAGQAANLNVLFDTEKREYELEQQKEKIDILTKNNDLHQANLREAVMIRNIIIGFTILVLIVSLLLYRMVRLNKKAVKKIAKTNSMLGKLVSEKEWLLKEVHHRVKNNLHTVMCLLESQSAYLHEDALKAVEESRHRIYAMSLIHQKLYEHDDVKTIDMRDYVNSLVHYLEDCFDLKNKVNFKLDVAPVSIDASIAIPIGLLINEAVTNAIKYAFVGRAKGQIAIRLYEEGEKIALIIADDGVGIDPAYVSNPTGSMGLQLIKGLTGDIGGDISINTQHGTEIKLVCTRVLVEEEISKEELLNNIPDDIDS